VVDVLRKRNHDVQVLTSDFGATSDLIEEQHVHRKLKLNIDSDGTLSGDNARHLDKANTTILREELMRTAPDVVHVWSMRGLSYVFLMQLQKLKIPIVYDVSDTWLIDLLNYDKFVGWWNRPARKKRLFRNRRSCQHGSSHLLPNIGRNIVAKRFHWPSIYFCSNYLKNIMLERGHAVENAPVIQCFFEFNRYQHKNEYGKSEKLMWVGDFSDKHDPATAIQAFHNLVNKGNKYATLHLYGENGLKGAEIVHQRIQQLGLEERVFVQTLDSVEQNEVYAEHDALIFTSVCEDPFPMIPLYAMAARLPVIVARNGGAPEIVKDDFNGLTFKTGDALDLEQKIATLFGMRDHGAILGRNGLDFVQRSLKKDEIVGQIEECLLQALTLGVDYTI